MPTHFLNKLPIAGRERALSLEPNFDFYRTTRVFRLTLDCGPAQSTDLPSLHIVVGYADGPRQYVLTMLMEGVRDLLLPRMTPQLFLPELEIEDVGDRLLEGIRFEVTSRYEHAFRCSCANFMILDFQPL